MTYLQLLVLHLCDSSESGKCNWVDPQVPNGLLPNRNNVYQKNQPKVLSPSFTHQPIPYLGFHKATDDRAWTHQGRSRATEVLGFLTWKQKTPKKSQQLKWKDTDMTDLKYDVTSRTNVPTNMEHNAPSAASYRFLLLMRRCKQEIWKDWKWCHFMS